MSTPSRSGGHSGTILNNVLGRLPSAGAAPESNEEVTKLKKLLDLCPLVNPPRP
jgi:hypothetical protein